MSKEKEKYLQQIKQLIPICDLPEQAQNDIIAKADVEVLKKKKFLFKQGDRDDYSYYLLEGEVELLANNQLQNSITGGSDRALYAMAQLQPRQFSARAKVECFVFKINRNELDKIMVMSDKGSNDEQAGFAEIGDAEMEVSELDAEDDVDWMTRMLQSELFARIPMANMHHVFAILEPVEFNSGDAVITQGEPGDHYYIIAEGKCTVTRKPKPDAADLKLAVLGPGDSFGEEALIMDSTRNATITMNTDGILMQLSKDNFNKLIKEPTLNSVSWDQAQDLVHKGAEWIDVRFENEYKQSHVKNSINIPLNLLRMKSDKISQDKEYIAYCDTGGRSSTAAFLLIERGYQVHYLKGGLISNPNAATESSAQPETEAKKPATAASPEAKATATPAKPDSAPATERTAEPASTETRPAATTQPAGEKKSAPETAPASAVKPEAKPEPADAKTETQAKPAPVAEEKIDPDVQASVIAAELERTNMKLQDAERIREEVAEAERKKQDQIVKELEKERKQLEQQKKTAQKEAEKIRQDEEKRIAKMKQESEKQLQKEKKKLEEIYNKNTSEMENLQKMRQELEAKEKAALQELEAKEKAALEKLEQENAKAEQKKREAENLAKQEKEKLEKESQEAKRLAQEEKDKLEKESQEAKRMLEEARRMKEELEATKLAMQQQSEASRKEQEEKEKELQEKVKAKLEAERRKLADQLAKNNMDLEQAQKEKAAAEAARKAAHEEAQKIIDEFKREHEETRKLEEEKLQQEREKLEHESTKLKDEMDSIHREKEKAEQEKLDAQKQIAMLKIKSVQNKDKDEEIRQNISNQIKQVEERISEADKQIEHVQTAERQVASAVQLNAADLQKQSEEEARLQKQLESELQEFITEHEEQTKEMSGKFTSTDYMQRIKERAEAARKEEEQKTESLFADVASMLDDDD